MSAKIFGKVWELEIDPIEKLVLLALADHADHEGNNVRPGNKLLCAKTGLSERTIGLKIADFLERGILLPVQTTTGRGNIREFAIDVDAIPRAQYFINKEKLKIEAGSTFKTLERSKQVRPLSKPQGLKKVEADDIKVEVDGSPYKEGTVMNLIGDVDTPHAPSQSFVGENTHSLLGDGELCECGDRKFEHAQTGECLLNGLGHGLPSWEPANKCLEFRGTGHRDTTGMQSVHVNGVSDAPPPIGPPPTAQAAVTVTPTTSHLRVLSPLAESTTSDQPEEAKMQGSPVSAQKRPISRKVKAEKIDSPEEVQRKADHKILMNHIAERMGKLDNPPGQAKAVSEMLKAGHSVERIKQELETQLKELLNHKRRVVTWNTVRQTITSSVFAEQQSQIKTGGNNGNNHTSSNRGKLFEYLNSKPFQRY